MRNIILLLFLHLIHLSGKAQETLSDSLNMEKLKTRIEKLEEFKDIRDERFDDQLELLKEKNNLRIDKAKLELRDEIRPIKWAIGAVSIVALFAFGAFIYQMIVGIKKEAVRQLKKNLQNHLKENSDLLLTLIGSQRHEERMKLNAKIITLSASDVSSSIIEKTLTRMGFKNVEYKTVERYEKLGEVDLVIINNSAKDMSEDIIFEFLKNTSDDILFVCFYPERLNVPSELNDKINFANKPFTLYHQIIQTLSFQSLFKIT